MDIKSMDKAQVLAKALPYIQKHNNKIIVIKYGGNAMIKDELKDAVISDIVLLSLIGIKVVVIHGGGPEISEMLKRVGKESRFVNGLRYTDRETMDIVQMVLCGKVNKDLVSLISSQGGKGIGICGLDSELLMAHPMGEEYGYVGDIAKVNPCPVITALNNGYIPVIATVAKGEDGQAYNVNADTAAAKIAAALGAEKLILLTDIKGLMQDINDENSLIPVVNVSSVPALIKDGIIKGGMIPKIDCCVETVRRGVRRAHIIDGRIPHSILIELFSDEGIGTMIM